MRKPFVILCVIFLAAVTVAVGAWAGAWWAVLVLAPLVALGIHDLRQRHHALQRIYPVIGHGRYLLEELRPEVNQYFVESNLNGRPFSRELRSIVYARAKGELDTLPFGTQRDVYAEQYEWLCHSLAPQAPDPEALRITIGTSQCGRPYSASRLHISAMSYGALGDTAIRALNAGAKLGGFAHNTGEGGLSPYHAEPGGDLIWQVGTGYFGCRTRDGGFCADTFAERAALPSVRMIEIKLSQGAKPSHGGILPACKVTPEIAAIRGVPLGRDVISPPAHSAFDSPTGLLEFVARLRELSGGKPVGFKLCVGLPRELFAVCKAILETEILPDFITVDGAEGGTGAAPLEYSNAVGMPLRDGLALVHSALTGIGVRDRVRIIASGKIITGFHMFRALALGADVCASARGMMFALGCIQARRCNANTCPVGVATQDPRRTVGLDPADKSVRVYRYHKETVEALADLVGAAGLRSPDQIEPQHMRRRVGPATVRHYGELYAFLESGALLEDSVPAAVRADWQTARADRF